MIQQKGSRRKTRTAILGNLAMRVVMLPARVTILRARGRGRGRGRGGRLVVAVVDGHAGHFAWCSTSGQNV